LGGLTDALISPRRGWTQRQLADALQITITETIIKTTLSDRSNARAKI
jgi:hypothetical protein